MRLLWTALGATLLLSSPTMAQTTQERGETVRLDKVERERRDRDRREIDQLRSQQRRIERQVRSFEEQEQQRSAPVTRPSSRDSVVRTQ